VICSSETLVEFAELDSVTPQNAEVFKFSFSLFQLKRILYMKFKLNFLTMSKIAVLLRMCTEYEICM
jgi:hypothetical protein